MSVPFYLSFAALWILVVFHSLVLVSLVRTVSQLQRKDDGGPPQLNQEAPKFCGVALSGAAISSADFAGRLTALLFVSARCPSCMITIEEMKALRSRVDGSVIVICEDDRSKCARLAAVHKLDLSMVVDYDQRIGRLFNIPGPRRPS